MDCASEDSGEQSPCFQEKELKDQTMQVPFQKLGFTHLLKPNSSNGTPMNSKNICSDSDVDVENFRDRVVSCNTAESSNNEGKRPHTPQNTDETFSENCSPKFATDAIQNLNSKANNESYSPAVS